MDVFTPSGFAVNCMELLHLKSHRYHAHGRGEAARRGDAVTGNPRPPQYLSKHAKVTSSTLSEKARDTAHSVRKMLEAEGFSSPSPPHTHTYTNGMILKTIDSRHLLYYLWQN